MSSEFAQPSALTSQDRHLDVTLIAAAASVPYAGGTQWASTYNGTTPGPTLRVRPGDVLTVTLVNRWDAPTNLHTHGLHVSPEGDSDNVFVMIDPGQSHTSTYRIPADHPSGTFWYHPHHHGEVARQVFGGMAGVIIVEDAIDRLPEFASATERVLVFADANIGDSDGVLDAAMDATHDRPRRRGDPRERTTTAPHPGPGQHPGALADRQRQPVALLRAARGRSATPPPRQ